MRDVEQHADTLHFFNQLAAFGVKAPFAAGAIAVRSGAVVSRAEQSQSRVVPFFDLLRIENSRASLHAEDVADRLIPFGIGLPLGDVGIERFAVGDGANRPSFFHRAVVGELTVTRRISRFSRLIMRERFVLAMQPGQQRADRDADSPFAKFGPGDGAVAGDDAGELPFEFSQLVNGEHEVAVPFDGIPGHIEVGIKDEHERGSLWRDGGV